MFIYARSPPSDVGHNVAARDTLGLAAKQYGSNQALRDITIRSVQLDSSKHVLTQYQYLVYHSNG